MDVKFTKYTKATLDDITMKDIEGYEGLYAITSCGKVWSYRHQKFLKTWSNGTPYWLVTLVKDGKKKNYRVHRLVARAYLCNPYSFKKVDHKDTDTSHNYLNNLRWVDNVVNGCNRKNNIAIFDIETCQIYCSLAKAVSSTNQSRRSITRDCKLYRDTKKEARFFYLADLSESELTRLIGEYFKTYYRKNAVA